MSNNGTTFSWAGRTVLVTGAEGFIGSTLVDLLLEQGAKVRAFVHYKPYADKGHLAHLMGDPRVEMLAGDVRDAGRVTDAVEGCDTVFHLAALIGIPYSYDSPGAYVQTNVVGTENVAEASPAALRAAAGPHLHERGVRDGADRPHLRGAPAPAAVPLLRLEDRRRHDGALALARLRAAGDGRPPLQHLRPAAVRPSGDPHDPGPTALRRTGDQAGLAHAHRDFTYVTDTARGFIALAECEAALGHAVNLGVGQEISIGELAQALIEASGRDAKVVVDPSRLRPSGSEVQRLLSDNSRAREWAGWTPAVSLAEGLKRTSSWVAENLHLFAADRYQV